MPTNATDEIPPTPIPDPPDEVSPEDAPEKPAASRPPIPMANPSTASGDDLSVLLTQSAPDPFLTEGPGSGDRVTASPETPGVAMDEGDLLAPLDALASADQELGVSITTPDAERSYRSAPAPPGQTGTAELEHPPRGPSWTLLLIASYASALTLGAAYLLWTGRKLALPPWGGHAGSGVESPDGSPIGDASRTGLAGEAALPLPSANMTELGRPARLGEIEVTPRSIAHRPLELIRLEGTRDDQRESAPVLVLTLELVNRSSALRFAPLDLPLVRDLVPAVDQSCIELPTGRRIPLFQLAIESEWSIFDQTFPALNPGDAAETIVASAPVSLADLKGEMTWHVKLRTGPYRTEVLGVRFTADRVAIESR